MTVITGFVQFVQGHKKFTDDSGSKVKSPKTHSSIIAISSISTFHCIVSYMLKSIAIKTAMEALGGTVRINIVTISHVKCLFSQILTLINLAQIKWLEGRNPEILVFTPEGGKFLIVGLF